MKANNQYYTYLVTDSNRTTLLPILGSEDPAHTKINSTQHHSIPEGYRIVLLEQHSNQQEAQRRLVELSGMTQLVRERLIRKNNPNWLSITRQLRPNISPQKKAAVYAL